MPHCIGAVTKTGVLMSWLLKIHGGDKWVVDAPLCSCHCPTWLPNEHHVVCCSSRTGDRPVAWKILRSTSEAPKKLHCVFIMLHAWICAFCKLETIWFCIRQMIAYEIWDSITFLTRKTIALTSMWRKFNILYCLNTSPHLVCGKAKFWQWNLILYFCKQALLCVNMISLRHSWFVASWSGELGTM